jgi:HAD superfamily hydrolase (TIGR01509 family)
MMAESVVFDMDGVLFDSERLYTNAWLQTGIREGLSDVEELIKSIVGRNGSDIRALLLLRYGAGFPADSFIADVGTAYREITGASGPPMKPGARELLAWLHSRGIKIALATSSGKAGTAENLEGAGIAQYFGAVVTGDMITRGKPAPDIYLLACEKLGALPEASFAVEDSPNGVMSARAAGLKVLLVPDIIGITEEIGKLAYGRFDSLFEVKAYFETL